VATITLDAEFPEQYAYEVMIFDLERDRRLVAAVAIVSPANKDRPESRQLFVAKCLNLLRQDVYLSTFPSCRRAFKEPIALDSIVGYHHVRPLDKPDHEQNPGEN
jgi:hypothetical protein